MAKLRLGNIDNGKPVKLTLELPAWVDRDLSAYARAIAEQTGQAAPEKARLAIEMLARFMVTDRGFSKVRRARTKSRETP